MLAQVCTNMLPGVSWQGSRHQWLSLGWSVLLTEGAGSNLVDNVLADAWPPYCHSGSFFTFVDALLAIMDLLQCGCAQALWHYDATAIGQHAFAHLI